MDTDTSIPARRPDGSSSTRGGEVPRRDRRTSAPRLATTVTLVVLAVPVAWFVLSMIAWAVVARGGE